MPRCISDIQHFRDRGNRDALGNGADSPRGTLTLPAKLRTKYRLDEGDSLTLVDLDAGILFSAKVQVVPKLAAEIERIRRSLGLQVEDLVTSGRPRDVENEWLVSYVITARWIGTRRNELLHLERRRLDLEAGKITLEVGSTKNGEGRIAYLPSPALTTLREWDEKTKALWSGNKA